MGDVNNLRGEQGGVVLDFSGTQQTYTSTGVQANIVGFTVIVDVAFSSITAPKLVNAADLIDKTFIAGSFIPIEVSQVTLSKGSCIGLFHENQ
jgi:hypothetical protein